MHIFRIPSKKLFHGCLLILCCTVVAAAQIQFSRPKNPDPLIENPQTVGLARDTVIDMVKQKLRDDGISLDEEKSKEKPWVIFTKPVIFTKGSLTSGSNLEFVSRCPASSAQNWLRGRFTLQIEAAPVDPQRTKLFVFARIEGEYQGEIGPKWVECPSRGVLESDYLKKFLGIKSKHNQDEGSR